MSGGHSSGAKGARALNSRTSVRSHLRAAIGTMIGLALLPGPLAADVVIDAPAGSRDTAFSQRIQAALAILERSQDASIRQLHAAVVASPATILIRPITDDPATWHADGDRNRSHTEPADAAPKSRGRAKPTGAIIYITPDVVDPDRNRWKSGVLAHELVHALDLAYGRYHRDYTVRERRAVLLQNVWRARLGYPLRTTYHGRFSTLDYQDAMGRGTLAELVLYVFTRPDFPHPPKAD